MPDQRPIVVPSSLQQLSNSDSLVFGQYIMLKTQASAPGTPTLGYGIIYVKTDGLPYFKNDSGTEFLL